MISTIWILISVKARSAAGALASMWQGNRLKVIAGAVTLGIIAPSMFLLFRFLFLRLTHLEDPDFGAALAARLLSSAFMAFTVFLAVSSMIAGISTLFRSRETVLLLSMPFRTAPVAAFRVAESWFHAGWSTILLGVPVIAAFASVVGRPPSLTAAAGAAALVPFVIVSVSCGTIVMSLLSRLGTMGGLRRGAGGVVLLSAIGLLLFFQGMKPDAVVIPDEGSSNLAAVERFVAGLPATGHSPWPHALLGTVLSQSTNPLGRGFALRAGLLLAGEALLASTLAMWLVCRGFRKRHSAVAGEGGRGGSSKRLMRGGFARALFEKDILLFLRDPVQLSQLGLLTGLFVMYTANLSRFSFDFSQRIWLGVAVFMNVSFMGFVMATLLVRFSFPSISLEGPGLLFVMQVPRARRALLRVKWLQALISVLPLMLTAGVVVAARLGAGHILIIETIGAILLTAFALSSINIALGSVFPRFGDNSAASIASSQGGIVAAFASMGFVLMMVSALSFATRAYLAEGFRERAMTGPLLVLAAVMVPVTALVSAASMRLASGSFARRDF